MATTIERIFRGGWLQSMGIIAATTFGGIAAAAFTIVAASNRQAGQRSVILRLAFWTLATGLPLYVFTRGPIYDRYVLVWLLLMPLVCVWTIPKWLLALQALLLAGINVYFIQLYFM